MAYSLLIDVGCWIRVENPPAQYKLIECYTYTGTYSVRRNGNELGESGFKIVVVYRFLAAKIRAGLSDYETKSDQYSVALDAVDCRELWSTQHREEVIGIFTKLKLSSMFAYENVIKANIR